VGLSKGAAVATLAEAIASETDECIIWPHSNNGSHPTMTLGGKRIYPHVVACVAANGLRPGPMLDASHQCGVPLCINPRHMAWEPHVDNCHRRIEHGTQAAGERHGQSKLTADEVAAIRSDTRSQTAIAADYGVSQSAVSAIKLGKRWAAS
jgi:hypothetical protein